MQTAIKIKTRVLAGNRVEFTSPELAEGEYVELIVQKRNPIQSTSSKTDENDSDQKYIPMLELVASLPPSTLTMEDWAQIEREIREDKDSWDR